MRGLYRIADTLIEINSIYGDVHELCADYRVGVGDGNGDGLPQIVVNIYIDDITREQEYSDRENDLEGMPRRVWGSGYLETLAVYRSIAEQMVSRGTMLFHGSAISVDGAGYIFTAKSGTGKSTHVRLWRQLLGSRAVMINDDKPLIAADKNGARVYGTPWNGKHNLGENICVPLKAICVIERGEQNEIARLTGSEAFPLLMQSVYRSRDPKKLAAAVRLLGAIINSCNVKIYRLRCNMDISAAKLSFAKLSEK